MSIVINSNTSGMNTVRNISLIQRSLSRTMKKLSSGEQINEAADAPADLVISEQMRSQIGSLTQQIRNLEFNLNKSNAADGAISELRTKMADVRGIALAASDEASATPETGKAYQLQMNDVVAAYNQQLSNSDYASQKLLDGSQNSVCRIEPLPQLDVATPDEAAIALEKISRARSSLDTAQEAVGNRSRNEYQSTIRSLEVASQNMVAAESQIRDTDYAQEQTELLKQLLQQQSGLAALAQGNLSSSAVFKLLNA